MSSRLMGIFRKLDMLLKWLCDVGFTLACVVALLIALGITVSIVSRECFGHSLFDAVTPGRLATMFILYLGVAWALREKRHISIKILAQRLPPKVRLWVHSIMLLIGVFAMGVVTFLSWEYAIGALRLGEEIVGQVMLPAFPFQVTVAVGLSLFCLEALRRIILDIAAALK